MHTIYVFVLLVRNSDDFFLAYPQSTNFFPDVNGYSFDGGLLRREPSTQIRQILQMGLV